MTMRAFRMQMADDPMDPARTGSMTTQMGMSDTGLGDSLPNKHDASYDSSCFTLGGC